MKKIRLSSKSKKIVSISITILTIIVICISTLFLLNNKKNKDLEIRTSEDEQKIEEIVQTKEISIIDPESKSRPYAVMINNHSIARAHHAGLQDAYIIYEIIVEGGITRYMALFKDQETAKIGSVRSSRHYFLDYANENDAIYVHWGWSPQAQSDISTYKINNINGLTYEGTYFYRDKSLGVALEHTGFTTMEMLKKATTKLNYRTQTNKKNLLNYTAEPINFEEYDNTSDANTVSIKYSSSLTNKYVYDSETKMYKRYVNEKEHMDDVTKKQYTFKNIITYQISNKTISGDNKNRQDLANIGTGNGYYISEGKAIKIKWEKKSRFEQTKYMLLDGSELKVNDGNTFIQIQPSGQSLTIK